MKKSIFLLIMITYTIAQGQVVTTLVEEFPGDGEISIDLNGNIYVNDSGENGNLNGMSVYKVTPTGEVSLFRDGLPIWVVGSVFDLNGDLLVTGWSAGTISRIAADGSSDQIISTNINGAGSLEVDEFGNIYVAEYLDNAILKFDSDGLFLNEYSVGAPIQNPAGLAYVQATGKFYTSNWTNGNIIEIDTDGNPTIFATIPDPNVGPIKIFGNYLFATSPQFHKIYRIHIPTATVELFAGNGTAGNTDGDISSATFDTPTGLGILNSETMYVAENFQGTGRLRLISGVLGLDKPEVGFHPVLYPNPTLNKMILRKAEASPAIYQIFNFQGQEMSVSSQTLSNNEIEFNTELLLPGIYVLKVITPTQQMAAIPFLKK